MKKLLLFAAMAAMALGASADGYKLEKVWERTDVANLFISGVRQGFAVNGKFYINDTEWTTGGGTGEPKFYVYGETGEPTIIDGFGNTAVTADEAGHIIVSTAAFPANIAGSSIKVLDPNTLEVLAEYAIPEECGLSGRCDFFGVPQGDMTQDGVMYLTGGNTNTEPFTSGVAILAVKDGEIDYDNTYLCPVNGGITGQTSTVINYYKDLNGDDALIYAYRSAAPSKLVLNGNEFSKTAIVLPHKGACNGIFPFVWDGKELFIYPTLPNYNDGWAIAEAGAESPLIEIQPTNNTNPNGYQNHWLYAVVDNDGVTINEYVPGRRIAVWRLTKDVPAPKKVYILGEVNDQQWAANAGTEMTYDAENNVYTATVTLDGRGESGENYFSFTTELAENNDDGGWAYIAPFRFGAVAENDFWYDDMYDGQPLGLTYENGQAFRVMNGEYKLTVSLQNMTLTIERVAAPLLGDVNEDGFVNVTDVTMLINAVVNDDYSNINFNNGDMNGDGVLTVTDVTMLINAAMSN